MCVRESDKNKHKEKDKYKEFLKKSGLRIFNVLSDLKMVIILLNVPCKKKHNFKRIRHFT